MKTELELEPMKVEQILVEFHKLEVGDRVLYKALFNEPGNYAPDEMVSGTIINKFRGGESYIYRIELDRTYKRILDGRLGQKIIVGNIHGSNRIHPLG